MVFGWCVGRYWERETGKEDRLFFRKMNITYLVLDEVRTDRQAHGPPPAMHASLTSLTPPALSLPSLHRATRSRTCSHSASAACARRRRRTGWC